MTTYDIWAAVHSERRALATDLADLSPEQWATPSLCEGWDVHDVLAHQLETAKETRLRFIRRFAAAGFDFDRYNQRGVRAERRADPAETLAAFVAVECGDRDSSGTAGQQAGGGVRARRGRPPPAGPRG